MSIKKLLGVRIKELRVKSGFTQAQIAELVNIDPKHQSCIETGRNFPSGDLIEKYAGIFNISAAEVLKLEHIQDRKNLEKDIINIMKTANDEQIVLIYKIVNDVIR